MALSVLLIGLVVRVVYEVALLIWKVIVFSFYLPEFIANLW